jgi:hypothetical protein
MLCYPGVEYRRFGSWAPRCYTDVCIDRIDLILFRSYACMRSTCIPDWIIARAGLIYLAIDEAWAEYCADAHAYVVWLREAFKEPCGPWRAGMILHQSTTCLQAHQSGVCTAAVFIGFHTAIQSTRTYRHKSAWSPAINGLCHLGRLVVRSGVICLRYGRRLVLGSGRVRLCGRRSVLLLHIRRLRVCRHGRKNP